MLTAPIQSKRGGKHSASQLATLIVLALLGLYACLTWLPLWFGGLPVRVRGACLGGAMAAGATALGSLPVLLPQKFSQRTHDGMLAFGAGVMLAATAFSLVQPAIIASRALGASAFQASLVVAAGMLGGVGFVMGLERLTRFWHGLQSDPAQCDAVLRRAWLFVAAVTIHNLPEGLAIGVSFASPDLGKAQGLATGISVQDIPEGLVVAMALRTAGYGRLLSVLLGICSGAVEPVAALVGVLLINVSAGALPWGLGLAAGAMLYVLINDVLPESHGHGNGKIASSAGVMGFILMMVLDTALG